MTDSLTSVAPNPPKPIMRQKEIWDAAKKMEAAFLSEMLKSAGLGETSETFGGGIGEDQFASFLREEQAHAMVEAGGIGLAEMLYQSLLEKQK